jgi:hypothetical protein
MKRPLRLQVFGRNQEPLIDTVIHLEIEDALELEGAINSNSRLRAWVNEPSTHRLDTPEPQ